MNRETFWIGFYIWFVIQFTFIVAKLIYVIEWSWWAISIPTIVAFLGGIYFAIWFALTCNPRIEKEDK